MDLQVVRHRLVAVLAGNVFGSHKAATGLRLEARLQVGGAPRQHRLALLVAGHVEVVAGRDYQRYAVRVQRVSATLRVHIVGLHIGHHD